MRSIALICTVILMPACASQRVDTLRDSYTQEATRYEKADVHEEVEARIREWNFRFKGWQKSIDAQVTTLPGITESDGVVIGRLKVPEAEVLYVAGLDPFVVPDQAAYERRMRAMFDYMRRFNQELIDRIKEYRELPKKPNQ